MQCTIIQYVALNARLDGYLVLQRNIPFKLFTLLDVCVSSLRRGHANILCIVPIVTDDPRRESQGNIPVRTSRFEHIAKLLARRRLGTRWAKYPFSPCRIIIIITTTTIVIVIIITIIIIIVVMNFTFVRSGV